MGFLLFLEPVVQEFVYVDFEVSIEAVQTFMASKPHALGNRFFLNLSHVGDLRSSKVVAHEVLRFD